MIKKNKILGYSWVIFGLITLFVTIVKVFPIYITDKSFDEGTFKKMPNTIDFLKELKLYLPWIIIFHLFLSLIVIYVSYSYVKEKQWSSKGILYLSKIYILLLLFYTVFTLNFYKYISIDYGVLFWESGAVNSLIKLGMIFIFLMVSIFLLKNLHE